MVAAAAGRDLPGADLRLASPGHPDVNAQLLLHGVSISEHPDIDDLAGRNGEEGAPNPGDLPARRWDAEESALGAPLKTSSWLLLAVRW
jgi:hypothetical protein